MCSNQVFHQKEIEISLLIALLKFRKKTLGTWTCISDYFELYHHKNSPQRLLYSLNSFTYICYCIKVVNNFITENLGIVL